MAAMTTALAEPAGDIQNARLDTLTANQRVAWALAHAKFEAILTSSFGAQSAVMLHLVTRHHPKIPVVLIDTGYLFPETYRFIDELTERLSLQLMVYRPSSSAAWQEARYGQLWAQGPAGLERYNELNKVEPIERALAELQPTVWFAGLRCAQSQSRRRTPVTTQRGTVLKVHPIVDWSDRDVYDYLTRNDLPYHPLWDAGYVSIGDVHTVSRSSGARGPDHCRQAGLAHV